MSLHFFLLVTLLSAILNDDDDDGYDDDERARGIYVDFMLIKLRDKKMKMKGEQLKVSRNCIFLIKIFASLFFSRSHLFFISLRINLTLNASHLISSSHLTSLDRRKTRTSDRNKNTEHFSTIQSKSARNN
jgi:hypothetical protein